MGKTAILIDHNEGNKVTVVQDHIEADGTRGVTVDGAPITPTGKTYTPTGPLDAIIALARGETITDTAVQSAGDGKEPRKVTLRPGDDIPIPGPKEVIQATLEHPKGIASYGWKVPAGVSGRGWIKGRSVSGDNFSVRYALGLTAVGDAQLGSPVGSMELPINFDGDEKGGMSNTGPGFNGKLTLDNVSGSPMVLQITRA